jgi:hypothetical protein
MAPRAAEQRRAVAAARAAARGRAHARRRRSAARAHLSPRRACGEWFKRRGVGGDGLRRRTRRTRLGDTAVRCGAFRRHKHPQQRAGCARRRRASRARVRGRVCDGVRGGWEAADAGCRVDLFARGRRARDAPAPADGGRWPAGSPRAPCAWALCASSSPPRGVSMLVCVRESWPSRRAREVPSRTAGRQRRCCNREAEARGAGLAGVRAQRAPRAGPGALRAPTGTRLIAGALRGRARGSGGEGTAAGRVGVVSGQARGQDRGKQSSRVASSVLPAPPNAPNAPSAARWPAQLGHRLNLLPWCRGAGGPRRPRASSSRPWPGTPRQSCPRPGTPACPPRQSARRPAPRC